ncbi:MAG: PHP domain-containing protein [Candidatus Rokubacteria bacterium]|nr:PHP domain-containing protein [Candidatus Rokubacteria bacterium]
MSGGVDLHSHTTASDGALSPRELVREAARRGVRVLAITDHDSTEALAEAFDEVAKHPPMTLIPGIEINCDVDGGEVHILGYFLDYEVEWFQAFLREQRAERKERVYRMAARLAELGMPIDPEEVFALVKEGSAGRPHVAQVLVARGYVKTYREAFDRYLRAGGSANVPRKTLSPSQAIATIRKAGGVPVLAHPGLADLDGVIPALVNAGLMGIECYYQEHSAAKTLNYLRICKDLNLVATGGSDFHGVHIGRTNPLGSPAVPLSVYEALKAKAEESRATRPT